MARTLLVIILSGAAAHAQTAVGKDAPQFVGAWRLVSWTTQMADGSTRPGGSNTGNLIYTTDGRMCANLQNSKKQKWSGPPKALDEAVARMAGNVSYCARVEVNASEAFVLHHVDLDFNPAAVGTIRKRWYVFDGPNRLRLRIDPGELPKEVRQSELVWERMIASK
jgi:hypothetical protein